MTVTVSNGQLDLYRAGRAVAFDLQRNGAASLPQCSSSLPGMEQGHPGSTRASSMKRSASSRRFDVLKKAIASTGSNERFSALIEALKALLREERHFGLARFCTDQIEPSLRAAQILCSAKFRDHYLWGKLPFGSLAAILDIAFDSHQEAKPLSNAERTQRLKARQLEIVLRLPRPAQLTVTRQRANRYKRAESTGDTEEPESTWERSHAIVAISQERSRAGFLWWFYLPNSLHQVKVSHLVRITVDILKSRFQKSKGVPRAQVTMNSFVSLQFWLGIGGNPANHLACAVAHT
eukprot:2857349-Rhodomonas_salina.1